MEAVHIFTSKSFFPIWSATFEVCFQKGLQLLQVEKDKTIIYTSVFLSPVYIYVYNLPINFFYHLSFHAFNTLFIVEMVI